MQDKNTDRDMRDEDVQQKHLIADVLAEWLTDKPTETFGRSWRRRIRTERTALGRALDNLARYNGHEVPRD